MHPNGKRKKKNGFSCILFSEDCGINLLVNFDNFLFSIYFWFVFQVDGALYIGYRTLNWILFWLCKLMFNKDNNIFPVI